MRIAPSMRCVATWWTPGRRPAGWLVAVALLTAALLLAAPLAVGQGQTDPYKVWDWKMPGELYKHLNHIHRAQLDKAANLFRQGFDIMHHHQWRNMPEKRRQAVADFLAAPLSGPGRTG